MRESATYREIIGEGRAIGAVDEARRILIGLGTKRFGEPDDSTKKVIEKMASTKRLESLAERVLDVESWADLLASP